MGLYNNMRRVVVFFCAAIGIITVSMLALRLTVFSDMELEPAAGAAAPVESDEIAGGADFPYTLNGMIYFHDASAGGNVMIENPETNEYLLSVDIALTETKVSLYYSGAIEPGTYIETAPLSAAGQKLLNGTYQCTAEITARDPKTFRVIVSEKKPVTVQIGSSGLIAK